MLDKDKWLHLLRTLSFVFSFSVSVLGDRTGSSSVLLKLQNTLEKLSSKGLYTQDIWKELPTKHDMHKRLHIQPSQSETVFRRFHKVFLPYSKKSKKFKHVTTHSNRLVTLLETLNSDIFIDIGRKRSPRPPPPKEYIYGNDERKTIEPSMIKQYPYINVVRLSVGCTGTLLTPSYVLTAAHCVHDGESFKRNIEMLKVYVPSRIGFRTYYVRKISVPYLWLKTRTTSTAHRAAYDYAVIQLNVAIHGRRSFMPLQVPSYRLLKEDLYFLGFNFRENLLLKSKCSDRNRFFYKRNVLLSHCDSTVGNSGATLFHENRRSGARKLIGIVSNTANAKTGGGRWAHTTFITLMTINKVRDICDMIYPEGEHHNVCPSYARGDINGASLSFFG